MDANKSQQTQAQDSSRSQARKAKEEARKKRAALAFVEKQINAAGSSAGAELKLKIILVGSSGVGKTSLVAKFLDETANIGRVQLTVMCDFFHCMLRLAGKTVQLRIWDTGGMERFDAANLTSSYYRNAHGVMLVYSVSDADSFAALPRWLERTRASVGPGHRFDCCVVGNKADNSEAESSAASGPRRMVSRREAQRFANQLGFPHIETSALAVVNVQKAFVDLTLAAMRRVELAAAAAASGNSATSQAPVKLVRQREIDTRAAAGVAGGSGGGVAASSSSSSSCQKSRWACVCS